MVTHKEKTDCRNCTLTTASKRNILLQKGNTPEAITTVHAHVQHNCTSVHVKRTNARKIQEYEYGNEWPSGAPETSWTQCRGQEKERVQPENYAETAELEVYITPIIQPHTYRSFIKQIEQFTPSSTSIIRHQRPKSYRPLRTANIVEILGTHAVPMHKQGGKKRKKIQEEWEYSSRSGKTVV